MTPKGRQIRNTTLTVTVSLGALTPLLAWIAPRVAPMFNTKPVELWLALGFCSVQLVLIAAVLWFAHRFGEYTDAVLQAHKSARSLQRQGYTMLDQAARLRNPNQSSDDEEEVA